MKDGEVYLVEFPFHTRTCPGACKSLTPVVAVDVGADVLDTCFNVPISETYREWVADRDILNRLNHAVLRLNHRVSA